MIVRPSPGPKTATNSARSWSAPAQPRLRIGKATAGVAPIGNRLYRRLVTGFFVPGKRFPTALNTKEIVKRQPCRLESLLLRRDMPQAKMSPCNSRNLPT